MIFLNFNPALRPTKSLTIPHIQLTAYNVPGWTLWITFISRMFCNCLYGLSLSSCYISMHLFVSLFLSGKLSFIACDLLVISCWYFNQIVIIFLNTKMICMLYQFTSNQSWSTLQEENAHWNLKFTVTLMANLLNFCSAYYKIHVIKRPQWWLI